MAFLVAMPYIGTSIPIRETLPNYQITQLPPLNLPPSIPYPIVSHVSFIFLFLISSSNIA
jgi:hypothetical protein